MAETLEAVEILGLLRDGRPRTKTELAKLLGKARSTVSLRLADLQATGLVEELAAPAATRGRPSALYALATSGKLIGAAELASADCLVAITDLAGRVLAQESYAVDPADGPVPVLDRITATLATLLAGLGRSPGDLVGVGLGVPGPVDPATGQTLSPMILPGWDQFDIVGHIQAAFPGPVVVDNDVNVMAVGEWVTQYPDESDLILVKVNTGLGAGIVAGGRLIRGARGGGGDIGHIQVDAASDRLCRCGQTGCLEALASGAGIARTLSDQGVAATSAWDVVHLVRGGDATASRVVREAGRAIGAVLAALVCALNPKYVILGGEIAHVGEPLLAGIREVVYARSQPAATSDLQIVTAHNLELASIIGASRLVQNHLFGVPTAPVRYVEPTQDSAGPRPAQ
ncbi:MAG: ROK family protein [Propionibacteriaceae bacterium]|jgi:predicted NBD/HSP70 family sugar kinase|nr:ROK family protein [Propionibacteriaceae bacterium]